MCVCVCVCLWVCVCVSTPVCSQDFGLQSAPAAHESTPGGAHRLICGLITELAFHYSSKALFHCFTACKHLSSAWGKGRQLLSERCCDKVCIKVIAKTVHAGTHTKWQYTVEVAFMFYRRQNPTNSLQCKCFSWWIVNILLCKHDLTKLSNAYQQHVIPYTLT